MRIAYFTNQYARASDTFIRNEVVELRARGHHVDTFSVRRPVEANPSPDVIAEQASTCYLLSVPRLLFASAIVRAFIARPLRSSKTFRLAMRVSPDGLRSRVMHVLYFLEAVFLADRLLRQQIQLLHNHIAENSATVAMLASDLSGIPFSMTVHGPGIFFHPERWALREKISRAAFTVCISDFCRSQCMLYSPIEYWPRLVVIRCGVGRHFENAALTIASPPVAPRILFVGRLCEEKGVPVLLEAMSKVIRAGRDCHLEIVGDGPLRPYVEEFIARDGLRDFVRLRGWRSSTEIVNHLAESRALVLPSFAEGLPVVVMEAMALGRPVVSTRIAGIPELLRDPECGRLIAPGSVDELVAAIEDMLAASPDRLREMGMIGADRVRRMHSLSIEVDKLETCFAAVAAVRPVGVTKQPVLN